MKVSDLVWLGQRLADAGRAEIRTHASDVPTAELLVMGDLVEHAPSTISALTGRTGYAQSRVSAAVASLVERGWAQTRADPADRRRTVVDVPEHVREDAQRFQSQGEAHALDRLLAGRTPARRAEIVAALDELLEVLREQAGDDRSGPGGTLHRALNADAG